MMKMQRKTYYPISKLGALILTGYLVLGTGRSSANLIVNGSFEDPVLVPANSYQVVTPAGWTDGAGLVNGNAYPTSPQDGNQFADIGLGASPALSQTFNVPTSGAYLLAWYDNALLPGLTYSLDVTLNSDPARSFSGISAENWTYRSLLVNLPAGPNVLTFKGTQTSVDSVIDNVSLVEAPPSGPTVPDGGSTTGLLGMSLVALGFLRRMK